MKRIFQWLFVIFSFISCSKTTAKKTNNVALHTQLITSGVWQLSDYSYGCCWNYGLMPSCRKDDTRLFRADGAGEVNEGPSKCDAADPQTVSFQWSFNDEAAQLLQIMQVEYVIDLLNDHELKFHKRNVEPWGNAESYTYTK